MSDIKKQSVMNGQKLQASLDKWMKDYHFVCVHVSISLSISVSVFVSVSLPLYLNLSLYINTYQIPSFMQFNGKHIFNFCCIGETWGVVCEFNI